MALYSLRDESLCGFEPDSEKWWLLTSISLSDFLNTFISLTPSLVSNRLYTTKFESLFWSKSAF